MRSASDAASAVRMIRIICDGCRERVVGGLASHVPWSFVEDPVMWAMSSPENIKSRVRHGANLVCSGLEEKTTAEKAK